MSQTLWGGHPYPRFSVAPMLDVTDRHFRYFLRLISQRTLFYTEMVTTGALLYAENPQRFLDYSGQEHPVALQLGGSNPDELARCTELATRWGYDEINLNVGCPSDRVRNQLIGACLMEHPARVADCLQAMQAATHLPVTVKCRIGIDDQDEDADLEAFIQQQQQAGCQIFILHARKAWLQGLSPRENRDIPPLNYGRVYRLKEQHPALIIGINGGINTFSECLEHLQQVDSVMLGRAIWNNPWLLAEVDSQFYGEDAPGLTRHQVIRAYLPYVEARLQKGDRLNPMIRPLLGVFQGVPGARRFRRLLSEHAHRAGTGPELLEQALALVPEEGSFS